MLLPSPCVASLTLLDIRCCCIVDSERAPPQYTAYCALEHQTRQIAPKMPGGGGVAPPAISQRYIVLGGSNGLLYLWAVLVRTSVVKGPHGTNIINSSGDVTKCSYLGAVELPVKMQYAVSIAQLGDRDCPPRLAVLSVEGHCVVLDVEGLSSCSVGYWTAVADLPSRRIVGNVGGGDGSQISVTQCHAPCKAFVGSRHSMTACGDYLAVVGVDGALRVFNSSMLIGDSSFGGNTTSSKHILGKPLKVRERSGSRGVGAEAWEGEEEDDDEESSIVLGRQSTQNKNARSRSRKLQQQRSRNASTTTTTASVVVDDAVDYSERGEDGDGGDLNVVRTARLSHAEQLKANTTTQEEEVMVPLFELAHIMPKDREVNEKKLKSFLNKNGKD